MCVLYPRACMHACSCKMKDNVYLAIRGKTNVFIFNVYWRLQSDSSVPSQTVSQKVILFYFEFYLVFEVRVCYDTISFQNLTSFIVNLNSFDVLSIWSNINNSLHWQAYINKKKVSLFVCFQVRYQSLRMALSKNCPSFLSFLIFYLFDVFLVLLL